MSSSRSVKRPGTCPGTRSRREADRRPCAPRAAPEHPRAIIPILPGRAILWRAVISVMVAILHPLPDVASSIVQTEGVRREAADRRGLLAVPLAATATAVGIAAANVITPPVCRGRSCPSHVFPFGLGWKPIGFPRLLAQPVDVVLRVVPAHIDDRLIATPPASNVAGLATAPARGNACVPLSKGHLVLPDHERLRNRHRVLRPLVVDALASFGGDPIVNSPAGTATMTGHCSQSRSSSLGTGPFQPAAGVAGCSTDTSLVIDLDFRRRRLGRRRLRIGGHWRRPGAPAGPDSPGPADGLPLPPIDPGATGASDGDEPRNHHRQGAIRARADLARRWPRRVLVGFVQGRRPGSRAGLPADEPPNGAQKSVESGRRSAGVPIDQVRRLDSWKAKGRLNRIELRPEPGSYGRLPSFASSITHVGYDGMASTRRPPRIWRRRAPGRCSSARSAPGGTSRSQKTAKPSAFERRRQIARPRLVLVRVAQEDVGGR